MKESEKTFNQAKEIGRMFPQGIEASKIFFQGNLIFSLGGGIPKIKTMTIRDSYNAFVKIGSYVYAYPYYGGRVSKIKNGQYEQITVSENRSKFFSIPKYEMLVCMDTIAKKFFFIREDGIVEYPISDTMNHYVERLLPDAGHSFLIVGNVMYIGTFFEQKEEHPDHLFNARIFIRLDEDMNPISDLVYEEYGVNEAQTILPDTEYSVRKTAYDIIYDEASDTVFLKYPYKLLNHMVSYKYVSVADFNGLTWTDVNLIEDSEIGDGVLVFNLPRDGFVPSVGGFAMGGTDIHREGWTEMYTFNYIIPNYEAWLMELSLWEKYKYELEIHGQIIFYHEGKFYTVSNDTYDGNIWVDPPLLFDTGIRSTDNPTEEFEFVADTEIDMEGTTSFNMGTVNGNEVFLRIRSGLNTIIDYLTF